MSEVPLYPRPGCVRTESKEGPNLGEVKSYCPCWSCAWSKRVIVRVGVVHDRVFEASLLYQRGRHVCIPTVTWYLAHKKARAPPRRP